MSDRIYHITRDTLIVLIVCVAGFIAGAVVHAPQAQAASSSTTLPAPGEWEHCVWDGVRWNDPCVYDHRHGQTPGTQSFRMFAGEDGSVVVDNITHRRAHRLIYGDEVEEVAGDPTCQTTVSTEREVVRPLTFSHRYRLFTKRIRITKTEVTTCVNDDGTETSSANVLSDGVQVRLIVRRECATDEAEGVSCVWDARHLGNGTGSSFALDRDASLREISHLRAHRLLGYSVR